MAWDDPTAAALVTSLALLIGLYLLHALGRGSSPSGDDDDDPYKIDKCPNPNCARCRLYGELNASARRRLPWVAAAHRGRSRSGGGVSNNFGGGNGTGVASDGASAENNDDSGGGDDPLLGRVARSIRAGPDPGAGPLDEEARDGSGTTLAPIPGQSPTVLLVRDLPAAAVVTSLHRAACDVLERIGTDAILTEYRAAATGAADTTADAPPPSPNSDPPAQWLRNDTRDPTGRWDVLHLLNQGSWVGPNVAACPRTADAVRSLPGTMTGCVFGNAFVSVLRPGTVIEPHCGPTNVRHRLHFPLVVPPLAAAATASTRPNSGEIVEGEPELRVLDERITWTEGRCVVFDDSLVHSAAYPRGGDGDGSSGGCERHRQSPPVRVVLIVDLWHPDLTDVEREIISDLYPSAEKT